MIHAQEIDDTEREQIDLTERAISIESYLENMGVCPDCLHALAITYCEKNKDAASALIAVAVSEGDDLGQACVDAIDSLICSAYLRGFTVGMTLGRQHKP